jgi:hypothetical protein
MIFAVLSIWSMVIFATENKLTGLTPSEEKAIVAIGKQATAKVAQKLMKTMLGDIKATGLAGAARTWSKSPGLINEVADSFNMGMKIRRPTYQYRNPTNKPDDIDKVALDYILSKKYDDANTFSRKIEGKSGTSYVYYQPYPVTKKCLSCHSSKMSDEVKAVLDEKYPNDLSRNIKVGELYALIRIDLPEAALK